MRDRPRALREDATRPVQIDLATFSMEEYEKAVRSRISQEEEGALEFGHRMYAGAVVLVLGGLLQQFRGDVEAKEDEWSKASPLHEGCSFGQIVVAAANGVRHTD